MSKKYSTLKKYYNEMFFEKTEAQPLTKEMLKTIAITELVKVKNLIEELENGIIECESIKYQPIFLLIAAETSDILKDLQDLKDFIVQK